jgi:hypothetical protein
MRTKSERSVLIASVLPQVAKGLPMASLGGPGDPLVEGQCDGCR